MGLNSLDIKIAEDETDELESQSDDEGYLSRNTFLAGMPDEYSFKIYQADDALQKSSPVSWYVENLISEGSLSLLVGEAGSKKTWVTLALAVCLADGKEWAGLKTTRSRILFVDEESGEKRLTRRIASVIRGYGIDYHIPLKYVSLEGFNLRDMKGISRLRALIERTKSQVIFIDTLADIMPGADENSVKDVQPVLMALRRMVGETIVEKKQIAIIIIHHTNKNGSYRGSSAMKGAVDLLLTIESPTKSQNVVFRIEKTRDGEPYNFNATAHFGKNSRDEDTFYLTASTVSEDEEYSKQEKYIIQYLTDHKQATLQEVMNNSDFPQSVKTAYYDLVRKSIVHRIDTGGRGKPAIIELVSQPY